jgi:hypothetical protein
MTRPFSLQKKSSSMPMIQNFNEDLAEDQFDDLPFYEDKDDDYY